MTKPTTTTGTTTTGTTTTGTTTTGTTRPTLPPRWIIRAFWRAHRLGYWLTSGGTLWTTDHRRGWGALHLTTIGRHSGHERSVILGYLEDGQNLVTLAMNGWGEGDPAWWLNLRADPDAVVRLAHQHPYPVRAREATGAERERLLQRWIEVEPATAAHAAARTTPTPVVVLEPRTTAG